MDRITVSDTFQLTKEQAASFLKMTPLTFSKEITDSDIDQLKNYDRSRTFSLQEVG